MNTKKAQKQIYIIIMVTKASSQIHLTPSLTGRAGGGSTRGAAVGGSAIIVAGGKGLRMGADLPKQFLPIGGRPVLMHTLEAFERAIPGIQLVLVLPADQQDFWRDLCLQHTFTLPHTIATGGPTRFHSVKNGLKSLGLSPNPSPIRELTPNPSPRGEGNFWEGSLVAVHDGVRPFVSVDVIRRCFAAARDHGAAVPVVPVVETLRQLSPAASSSPSAPSASSPSTSASSISPSSSSAASPSSSSPSVASPSPSASSISPSSSSAAFPSPSSPSAAFPSPSSPSAAFPSPSSPLVGAFGGFPADVASSSSRTVDRSLFRLVQTPQTFQLPLLLRAYEQPYREAFTDDASVVEALGHPITLVEGNRENIKITTPFDLVIAEALLGSLPSAV